MPSSHTNATKYRCPRCSTRTCSLPCTKRHKKWAQCSGIRDPTAYLPRADLATPRGIDHDYNFLTSIERKIDGAERDSTERGVVLEHDHERGGGWRKGGRNGPIKGEVRLKEAMGNCGAIVRKAPAGMARAKQNKTFWNPKSGCASPLTRCFTKSNLNTEKNASCGRWNGFIMAAAPNLAPARPLSPFPRPMPHNPLHVHKSGNANETPNPPRCQHRPPPNFLLGPLPFPQPQSHHRLPPLPQPNPP